MRIIIVTQTFPPKIGGMQSVMKALAEELSNYYKTIVLPNNYVSKKILKEGKKGITLYQFYLPKFIKSIIKKNFLFFFGRTEDIFICDSWKSTNAIPKKFKKKIYVLAHGQEFLKIKKKDLIKKSLSNVGAIISNSVFTKNLSSNFLKNDIKNYVIPPTYMLPNTLVKKRFSSKNPMNFITVSRIEERKGLLESINAFNQINKKNPDLKFYWHILGAGPQLIQLKNQVKKYRLQEIIKFYGDADEKLKNKLFLKSNVFIMPSFQYKYSVEGFGIVHAEALRFGIPSVAGVDGGVKDVIRNNINGWNIDPFQVDKFEKLLLWIINHPFEVFRLGKQSQKIYLKEFTKKVSINKLLKVIS